MQDLDGEINDVVGRRVDVGSRSNRRRDGGAIGEHERAIVGLGIFGIVRGREVYTRTTFERCEEGLSHAGSQPRQTATLIVFHLFFSLQPRML